MKILVTGVAGAIGSHIAERLMSEGHTVVGIDALTDYYSSKIKKINAERPKGKSFISVAKGIEVGSLKTMSEVVREELGEVRLGVISGPSIAREVAQNSGPGQLSNLDAACRHFQCPVSNVPGIQFPCIRN